MGCKGSLLAMEVGTSNIEAAAIAGCELASSRASRKRALAPTLILATHRFCIHHIKPVGAGSPAMAVGQATSILDGLTPSRASPLPQWFWLFTDSVYTTSNLWERARPRWRCVRQHQCWLCWPHREQARSYSELGCSQILYTPTSNLWERACPRWQWVRQHRFWTGSLAKDRGAALWFKPGPRCGSGGRRRSTKPWRPRLLQSRSACTARWSRPRRQTPRESRFHRGYRR